MNRRAGAAWLALLLLGACQSAGEADRDPIEGTWHSPVSEPCLREGIDGDLLCGSLTVVEEPGASGSRWIDLEFLILRATGPDPAPDPVFVLAGGPGQSAVSLASDFNDDPLRLRRDIVLLDQRGTGGSNSLSCGYYGDSSDIRNYLGPQFPADEIVKCRDTLSKEAALHAYTTPVAVDDLERLRRAMGYGPVNLHGGSYGTRVGLVYLRRHPASIRSAVLVSLVPLDAKLPQHYARGAQEAMDALLSDCAGDAVCGAAVPNLRDEFQAVLDRLAESPVQVTVSNPATGEPVETELSRGVLTERIRLLMYSPGMTAHVPRLIHSAYEGSWDELAQLSADIGHALFTQISKGMQLSVVCSEDTPLITDQEARKETADTFGGEFRIIQQRAACAQWPPGSLPPDYHEPVHGRQPTLLLSGAVDPVSPPRLAEQVRTGLANSTHVVVPGAGHAPQDGCVESVIAAFVESATTTGLDTACVQERSRPEFEL